MNMRSAIENEQKPDATMAFPSELARLTKEHGFDHACREIVQIGFDRYNGTLGPEGGYNSHDALREFIEQKLRVLSRQLNEGVPVELLREPTAEEAEQIVEHARRTATPRAMSDRFREIVRASEYRALLTALDHEMKKAEAQEKQSRIDRARAEAEKRAEREARLRPIIEAAGPARERLAQLYRDLKAHHDALQAEENLGLQIPNDDATRCTEAMRGIYR